jgi:hypothetical protein
LLESIELVVGDHAYTQILDYLKIPFKCVHYHNYANVVEDYEKNFQKKVWKNKEAEVVVVDGTNFTLCMPIVNPKEHGGMEVKSRSESQYLNVL